MAWSMGDKVGSLGLQPPVVVEASDSLRTAAGSLWRENVGAAVVLGTAGRPLGILSERDVVAHAAHGEDLETVRVGDAMNTHLVAARTSDTAHDVAYQMLEHGIRHLPILDEEGRLVGMVSIRDILRPVVAQGTELPRT